MDTNKPEPPKNIQELLNEFNQFITQKYAPPTPVVPPPTVPIHKPIEMASIIRPSGWSQSTTAPYFNQKNAEKVKQIIEALEADPDHDRYFEVRKLRLTVKTFMQQFHQGWRWLMECHPDETVREKFKSIKEGGHIRVDKNGNVGVRIALIDPSVNELLACGIPVKGLNVNPSSWKKELDDYIELAEVGSKLVIGNQFFSIADKEYVRILIAQLDEFIILDLSDTCIQVARVGQEPLENIPIGGESEEEVTQLLVDKIEGEPEPELIPLPAEPEPDPKEEPMSPEEKKEDAEFKGIQDDI